MGGIQCLNWIFLASYVAGFEIDGIYPVSGGLGEVTIYGSNLNDLNDLRFRSETIQDAYCKIVARTENEIKCSVQSFSSKGIQMLLANDEIVEDITYLYTTGSDSNFGGGDGPRLGGSVFASRSGNCRHNEPNIESIKPASISTRAGVQLTISGCNLKPRNGIWNENKSGTGLKTDLTDYAIILTSGSKKTRCNVIYYYTTNDKIICETEEFPHSGDFFPNIYINGREVGANGYGKTCKTCRIRAFSNFNPLIKSILPRNSARNGDVIVMNARLFTDAYEQDRCALVEDDEECEQSSKVEEGQNYLMGSPKFTDPSGRTVGTCDIDKPLGDKPNVKLTNFDDGYITCKIASNYVGNVNVTFATSFNGISTSKPHLYSVVGTNYDLINFQLTPKVSSIENNSGSIAGGNEVVLNGGPFLEDETKVTFDGVEAEVISHSESQLIVAAPPKPEGQSCSTIGQRGFRVLVWDNAENNQFVPAGSPHHVHDINQASFIKKGQWTAHLEGFFLPPNDGFYSFLISSSHKARLLFAESGCKMDAEIVATVSDSSNYQDFFSDKERLIMQKIELKKGQPYYLRAEGYSTYGSAYNTAGFLNIGALFHSTTGENQTLMKYRKESQIISILDDNQSEIQDITFASDTSSSLNLDSKFKLEIDGHQTNEFSLRSSAYDISRELNNLSASSCQDKGFISAAFRNSMEDTSVWPGDRYHRTIRPFCGSRTYALDQGRRKTTVFDAKKVSIDPIDLNINPHVCFAYFGQIGEKITVTVEAGNWRGVRSYDLGISPTTQWRYKCINLLSDYLRKDPVVQKKIDETKEFVLKQFEFSSVTDEANIAFIDEFIIGRVEGFFEVKPTAIGIQPSGGYIQKFDVDWLYPNGMRTLRISFRTSDCGLDIGLIKLVNRGEAHFEEIRNPLTHFYTYGDYTVKVNRLSKISPGVIGNFGLKYGEKVLSANVGWTSRQLQQKIAAVFGGEFSAATISKKGTCRNGYVYEINWNSFGDKEEMSLENVAVTGLSIDAFVKTLNDGGLLIPHLSHKVTAQLAVQSGVQVYVRDILADCDNCDYVWSEKKTVRVNSVRKVSFGDTYIVTGGKFNNQTEVIVGTAKATVIQPVLENAITFKLPEVSGRVTVRTYHKNSGYSIGNHVIQVDAKITSSVPSIVGIGGGEIVKLGGRGFSGGVVVTIGGKECVPKLVTFDLYACEVPMNRDGRHFIAVNEIQSNIFLTYSNAISPKMISLSTIKGHVYGGEELDIHGINFGGKGSATIGDKDAEIKSWSDSKITLITPPNKPGLYEVSILAEKGKSVINKHVTYDVSVNNVFPKISSVAGGALLTIAGSGFGSAENTRVSLGDVECNVESVSEENIICRSSKSVKEHIIENGIAMLAGVQRPSWSPRTIVIQLGERVTWRWNIPLTSGETPRVQIQQTLSDGRVEYNGVGFQSEVFKATSGEYSHDFLIPGTYYYSSGWIEESNTIALTGSVIVEDSSSEVDFPINVFVDGHEAKHRPNEARFIEPEVAFGGRAESCRSLAQDGARSEDINNMVFHTFSFSQTPVIVGIAPKDNRPGGLVTIAAEGLKDHIDCLELTIGGYKCRFDNLMDDGETDFSLEVLSDGSSIIAPKRVTHERRPLEKIQCRLEHNNTMPIGELCGIEASIHQVGSVLVISKADQCINIQPAIKSLKPKSGSAYGGQIIEIKGEGLDFEDHQVAVRIGRAYARILEINFNTIKIEIPKPEGQDFEGYANVEVLINGQKIQSLQNIKYRYDSTRTPMIRRVSRVGTFIGVEGYGFEGDIQVYIGDYNCTLTHVTSNNIKCTAQQVPAGEYHPEIISSIYGAAGLVTKDETLIRLTPLINSIYPTKGSLRGGNLLTVKGLGFGDSKSMRIAWDGVNVDKYDDEIISTTTDTLILKAPKNRNYESKHIQYGRLRISMHSNSGVVTYPIVNYQFRQDLTPKLESCHPNDNVGGNTILSITGSDIDCSTVAIEIQEKTCKITACQNDRITCIAPFVNAGEHIVAVKDKIGGFGSTDVLIKYDLDIHAIRPDRGSLGGDQLVSIVGTGMTEDVEIRICDSVCEVVKIEESADQQTVTCLTPESQNVKNCKVRVSLNGQQAKNTLAYSYDISLTPIVNDIQPNRGQVSGGTEITIVGFGFEEGVSVFVGDYPCNIKSVTENEIICVTTKSDSSKVVLVKVNNSKMGKQQKIFQFWYVNRWSSPRSWGCLEDEDCSANMPSEDDIIEIPEGIELLLDQSTPLLTALIVNGGKLIFDKESDIHLRAQYILIVNGGHIQIGSENDPYLRNAHIELFGHRRSTRLPLYGSKMLAIHRGSLDMHGAPHRFTWTRLNSTAEAGDDTIELIEEPVDWIVGDYITIASTGGIDSVNENEQVQITKKMGSTIKFKPALQYRHLGKLTTWGSKTLDQRAEVGLLTRNVKISGNLESSWITHHSACPLETKDSMREVQTCFLGKFGEETGSDEFGVHMHFGPDTKHVRLSNVEVFNAGQAFELGKYPIHFHMVGNVETSFVKNCAIHHTFNRALTFHAVNHLLAENNVAYHVKGHTFFLEDGIETRNQLIGNLAIGTRSSSSLLSTDLWAASFWITNPDNDYIGNVAAGGSHNGFWLNPPGKPTGPSFTRSVCPRKAKMGIFDGNSAHSMGLFGLWIYPFYTPTTNGDCSLDFRLSPEVAKFHNFQAYSCKRGAEGVFVTSVQWHDFIVADNSKAGLSFMETKLEKFGPEGLLIKDSVIVGNTNQGFACNDETVGLETPWKQGAFTVDGLEFHNFEGQCIAINPCYRAYKNDCSNMGQFSRIQWHNCPNKVTFAWENEYDFHDMDGSFSQTGKESHVLTESGILPIDKCSVNPLPDFNLGKVNATICDSDVRLHRFGLNDTAPLALNGANMVIRNKYGEFRPVWRSLRVTHPNGWLGVVLDGEEHTYEFEGFNSLSNLTYSAEFFHFQEDNHVIMTRKFTDKISNAQVSDRTGERSTNPLTVMQNNNLDMYLDDNTGDISYIISGKDTGMRSGGINPGTNVKVEFVARNDDATMTSEQETIQEQFLNQVSCVWSDTECWATETEVGKTTIPVDRHVWLDVTEIELEDLIIFGTLEFLPDQSYFIKANNIVIYGRMVGGSEISPFPCALSINIELTANHNSGAILKEATPPTGKKSIIVYGELELYGCQKTFKTRLLEPVQAGESTLVLDRNPDWDQGDQILISSTSVDGAETEIHSIDAISGNRVILSGTIQHYHDASVTDYAGRELQIQAQVSILNHNIIISGSDTGHLKFSGRILVAENDGSSVEKAKGVFSHVEFKSMGQFGYSDPDDPRFAIAFSGVTSGGSSVNGCSFRNSYSTSVGVINSFGVMVSNNIIHRTIGDAVRVSGVGHGNIVTQNVITNTVHPLLETDEGKLLHDSKFRKFPSAIRTDEATEAIELTGNHVSGVEGFGFRTKGERCSGPSGTNDICSGSEIKLNYDDMNHVLGAHHGINIWLSSHEDCSKLTNYASYRNYDYGIYLQTESSLVLDSVVVFDNPVSILPFVIKPEPAKHQLVEKSFTLKNSLIGGISDSFDCEEITKSFRYKEKTRGLRAPMLRGFTGYMMTTFMGDKNRSPIEEWSTVWSMAQILGKSCIHNNYFASFNGRCGLESTAISSNNESSDLMHPTISKNNKMLNVVDGNKFYFHRPKLEWVTSEEKARCIDMDCDGGKKILIKDDGGLIDDIGFSVTIISQSDFEWNGDSRRGLGDYRIPYVMLTNNDGTKRNVDEYAPHKGIIRDASCVRKADWNADQCSNLGHELVVFESLDADSMDRRVSPVGLRSDTGYIDLLNGPSAHKGDHGYSSVNRLSMFHMIVAPGHAYELALTGSMPQTFRLHNPTADPEDIFVFSIFIGRSQRIEVYRDNMLIRPNNAFIDKHGSFSYHYPHPKYIPEINSGSTIGGGGLLQPGENYFDRSAMTLYVVVRNNEPLDLKTSQTLIINMDTVMEMTAEELYSQKKLGPILASILNISSSNVKVVNIREDSTATGSRKRRQSMNEFRASLMFEVGTLDQSELGARSGGFGGDDTELGVDELLAIQNTMFEARTVCKIKTEMKSQLNIDVVQVSVDGIDEEGAPVSRSESFDGFDLGDSTADNSVFNPFGGAQESEKNPFNQSGRIVNTPTTLNIFRQPNLQIKEGEEFSVQPWIELLDERGARVYSTDLTVSVRLVVTGSQRTITQTKKKNKLRSEEDDVTIVEGIKLMGTTSVKISSDGFAKFNNLGITGSSTGVNLSLEFYLDGAEICGGGSSLMSRRSDAMKIEASNDENVIYCKTVSTSFSRKKKKNKGGSSAGGENVDCSGLNLVHLNDIITDMRIGNFIRVRTNGQPRNVKLTDITGINLADNKLTDGDNLKEFLSYLPSITSLTLDNNNFSKLPLNLTSAKLLFFSLMGNENMVELSPGAISLENMDKKTVLHFPCSMQYIPMDLLIGSKSAVQGFLKSAKFCP